VKNRLFLTAVLLVIPSGASAVPFPIEDRPLLQQHVLTLINQSRSEYGLSDLMKSPKIDRVAQGHADEIDRVFDSSSLESREATYLGHSSANGGDLTDRYTIAGVETGWGYAENVGYWTRDPFGDIFEASQYGIELMHTGMMAEIPPNDSHRKNILGDFTHVGIGLALDKVLENRENSLFLVTNFSRYISEEEERQRRAKLTTARSLHSTLIPPHGGPFMDVAPDHRFATAISSMKKERIIEGYHDGNFEPERTVNRAEMVKMLMDATYFSPIGMEFNACFSDVFNQWFAPYVCVARRKGWVTGYGDGSFRPERTVNRAEAVTLTARALPYDTEFPQRGIAFADVSQNAWFSSPLKKLESQGILPFLGSSFLPERGMQRGEAAEMLYRLRQNLPGEEEEEIEPKGVKRNLGG
jgi:uncharacterized protein YkwD